MNSPLGINHQGAVDWDGIHRPPWDNAFAELHFGELSLASIEESYFREKTLSNSLLYYFKDISQDDINILFFIF